MTTFQSPNDLLLVAGKALTIFAQGVLVLIAVVLLIGAPLVIFFEDAIIAEAIASGETIEGPLPVSALLGFSGVAVLAVAMMGAFFAKLRAIITSVGDGDPFEPANAERLNLMAWLLLGVEVVSIPVAGFGLWLSRWFDQAENTDVTIDVGLNLTSILMIIILFILARVFKHGAAMRDDLEGTV